MSIYRELLGHSAIYGLGQILARVASVLLLPLCTRCLSPADYGVINVLELTIGILSLVAAGGVAATVNRFHFESGLNLLVQHQSMDLRVLKRSVIYVAVTLAALLLHRGPQLASPASGGVRMTEGRPSRSFGHPPEKRGES